MPPKQVGMDVVVSELPVQIFFGNKVTFQQTKGGNRRSVDAREVIANVRSVQLENFLFIQYNT